MEQKFTSTGLIPRPLKVLPNFCSNAAPVNSKTET
jgi:hypothetical protein